MDTATCTSCRHTYTLEEIQVVVVAQKVPICSICGSGVVKPDIVFFNELPNPRFETIIKYDKRDAEVLIIMGTSLKVSESEKER